MDQLPSYALLADRLRQAGVVCSPAELHGLTCGTLAVMPGLTQNELRVRLAQHMDAARFPAVLEEAWQQLQVDVLTAYQSADGDLKLLLPDTEFSQRVLGLASWCEGSLAGFAESSAGRVLPESVKEALEDLVAISQVAEPDASNEEEREYLEQIEAHCATLAMHLFTDLAVASRKKRGLH